MAAKPNRLEVTLDAEHALKLRRLAEWTETDERTLARSLLSAALDRADPDVRSMTDVLEGIGGAFESAQLGLEQARRRLGVSLDDL